MLSPRTVSKIKALVIEEIRKAWIEKGHSLSNSLVNELEFRLGDTFIDVLMNDYGVIQNQGVPSSRVPYSGQGGGGTSAYIQGLMDYVAKRMGISRGTAENKAVAFAIANTHKKTGIRTRERGRGSKWLDLAVANITNKIVLIFEQELANEFEIEILKAFK